MAQAPNQCTRLVAKRSRAPRLAPAERRRQLIDAALSVLADEGLGHSTHSLVAARAGVALPTVLHYYPDHADLVEAALRRVSDFLLKGIAVRLASTVSDPAFATEEMLVTFAGAIEGNQDVVRVWLDWSTATRHQAWPRYLAFRTEACTIVASLLRQGQDSGSVARSLAPDEAAQVVVGLAHMIAQMHFSGSSLNQIQRVIHQLLASYLQSGEG